MIFEQLRIGGDRNFAYLIGDEDSRKAAVVDPAYSPGMIRDRLREHGLTLEYVINTHGHRDHAGGNREMKEMSLARIVAHPAADPEIAVDDGDTLELGSLTLTFIHTPGHTQDSLCVLVDGKLCSGDTLFVGKIGGTSTPQQGMREYNSLHNKLMTLPDDTEVYPGHDYGTEPMSTIGRERETNPFILQESFDDFLHLKDHWAEYKREHGID